jgi:hypothetical protein
MIKIRLAEFIFENYLRIRIFFLNIRMLSANDELKKRKHKQKAIFKELSPLFNKYYVLLQGYPSRSLITDNYKRVYKRLEKEFYPTPNFRFLRNPLIAFVMVFTKGGSVFKKQKEYLESSYDFKELCRLLEEDYIGAPLILDKKYLTSHNNVHHLYHLTKYFNDSKVNKKSLKIVVEWGGGYGNLAKLYNKLINNNTTYIMFDAPLFSCVQWLYLSVTLGKNKVNLITSPKQAISKGKINIIPVVFRMYYEKINADLFISTWALSESGKQNQDYVVKLNWYNANHLLLAFMENDFSIKDSDRMGLLTKKVGAKVQSIPVQPGNYYAFK